MLPSLSVLPRLWSADVVRYVIMGLLMAMVMIMTDGCIVRYAMMIMIMMEGCIVENWC